MTDPDDPSETSSAPSSAPSARTRGALCRPVLWVLLVTGAAGVTATTGHGTAVAVQAAFASATVACGTALIIQHYRNRRR
ncbi:hypothetical protein AGRA3207_002126 [Actinomadura graeca]|uniref:Secreted protein n=1 Tax=Actinomadura graeca TaxID=2750812 RepID=A0ABX8QRN6_9ACTN|nr:hypothetical protein [Actinomadura graeca]QXJ21288.1 hypothetical protein AGRA3207_002126 [Actinomadura graeca]